MDHFEITTEQSVYLIDDDEKNCFLAKKNGYSVIKVDNKDSVGCLTKINKLITIKSTTDEFTPDKIIDKELGALEDPKIYTRTQEVGSSSFFPTPEPSFQGKTIKE